MSDLCVPDGGQIRQVAPDLEQLTFEIKPVPPFRLDLTVQALRRRAINAVDRWDGTTFRRALVVDRRSLGIEVVQIAPSERPLLQVTVSGSSLPPSTRLVTMSALTRLLGVDRCLDDFYRAAAHDAGLGHLAHLFRGLKPPRFPTLFEALVNAFACQQVTLSLGIQLLNRLAATCARGGDVPGDRAYVFPSPADLAGRKADELRALGFSRQKGQAIIELASAVARRHVDLDELERLDDAAALARLRTLRGVGRWTAEYVLLRGLGRLHVFPGDDVGARSNLQRWLGLLEPLDYEGVQRTLAKWAPFQGLVYFHLLLRSLQLESASRARSTARMGQPRSDVMSIDVKRAYDPPARSDGYRVLVDRIWPRGVTKEDLKVDAWLKEVAPSTALRKWFGHDPKKWDEFRRRYARELEPHATALEQLVEHARAGHVTLVFAAKDTEHNNAVALREHLEGRLKR